MAIFTFVLEVGVTCFVKVKTALKRKKKLSNTKLRKKIEQKQNYLPKSKSFKPIEAWMISEDRNESQDKIEDQLLSKPNDQILEVQSIAETKGNEFVKTSGNFEPQLIMRLENQPQILLPSHKYEKSNLKGLGISPRNMFSLDTRQENQISRSTTESLFSKDLMTVSSIVENKQHPDLDKQCLCHIPNEDSIALTEGCPLHDFNKHTNTNALHHFDNNKTIPNLRKPAIKESEYPKDKINAIAMNLVKMEKTKNNSKDLKKPEVKSFTINSYNNALVFAFVQILQTVTGFIILRIKDVFFKSILLKVSLSLYRFNLHILPIMWILNHDVIHSYVYRKINQYKENIRIHMPSSKKRSTKLF
jgi:hypothetical protein